MIATVLVLSSLTICAQEKDQKEAEQRQELEKKTFALVNEIASAAWSLKLPENRVFILASAADLLWPSDEKRARTLYWDALNSINSIGPVTATLGETQSKADREKILQSYFQIFQLRQKILVQVSHRDGQLALDMLRATRQVPPRQLGPELNFAGDLQLEQEIASEVAAHDPVQALQLARQSLAKGLSFQLLDLLNKLNLADSEKATQFAGEIITKLQTANLATDFRASLLAMQLLMHSRNRINMLSATGRAKALSLSDDQKRQLVELLTTAALSASANSNLLAEISDLMPEIDQFLPDKRTAIEQKVAAFQDTLPREQRDQRAQNALIRNGMPEDIIRTAATMDDRTRMMLYQQASIIAIARGRSDSFRDFIGKEVNEGERRKILDFLDAEEISTAAGRKQLDDLRKLLPKIGRKEERARAMAELALMLKEKGEDEEAASLLDEAATLIKTDLRDEKQTNALLTLLCAYALIDPAKAFALAERTIDRANSQISVLMLLDKVVKTGAVKKSEIILDQGGIMPVEFLVLKYGKGVAALAKADFNRTRALADRFDRNELRLLAQLLIVKGLLQPDALEAERVGLKVVAFQR
jgi:hypothetical protein